MHGTQATRPPITIHSWRGLDNPTYYELTSDMQYFLRQHRRTGGNYNTYNPVAQNLIVDSLAYWRDTMGVDGFRFDLAPVLGNTCSGGLLQFQQRRQPHRASIASCASCHSVPPAGGSGTRPVRRALGHWRQFLPVGRFPRRLVGVERQLSRHAAPGAERPGRGHHHHRPVWPPASPARPTFFAAVQSVELESICMAVHDGFTLNDLYSCNGPNNNQPWPYGPSDGGNADELQLGPGRRQLPPSAPRHASASPFSC
jgi:isoamylase